MLDDTGSGSDAERHQRHQLGGQERRPGDQHVARRRRRQPGPARRGARTPSPRASSWWSPPATTASGAALPGRLPGGPRRRRHQRRRCADQTSAPTATAVDIAAPGWNITSTGARALTPPGYLPVLDGRSGTSFSAADRRGCRGAGAEQVADAHAGPGDGAASRRPPGTPVRAASTRTTAPASWTRTTRSAASGPPTSPVAGADGNDLPVRATALIRHRSRATIGAEGDVDWYCVTSAAARNRHGVRSPARCSTPRRTRRTSARVVYGLRQRPPGDRLPAVDSFRRRTRAIYEIPTATVATSDVALRAGTSYISVRNYNGSRDSRPLHAERQRHGSGGTDPAGPRYRSGTRRRPTCRPGAPLTTKPSVTFARAVNAATRSRRARCGC